MVYSNAIPANGNSRQYYLIPTSSIPKFKNMGRSTNGKVNIKFLTLPESGSFYQHPRPCLLFISAANFNGALKRTVCAIANPYDIPGEVKDERLLVFRSLKNETATKEYFQGKLRKKVVVSDD